MQLNLKWCLTVLPVILLAACAQPNIPQQPAQNDWPAAANTEDFTAEGRLAVKVEEKGSYANFDWAYQNRVQTINVNTPLGNTVGRLCQDSKGVIAIDAKGQIYKAETAAELSSRLLGFDLPVQYLHIWANGKRVADAPYQLLSDGRLQQFNWNISRKVSAEGLPRILLLENPKLTIRLVFDGMNRNPEPSAQTQCADRG